MDDNTRKTELARRWRWMPGMLTRCGVRLTDGGADYIIGHRPGATRDGGGLVDTLEVGGFEPDLDDPATLGGLLALVAEALRDPNTFLRWNGVQWEVVALYPGDDGRSVFGRADTKAEALVAALEAAPGGGS